MIGERGGRVERLLLRAPCRNELLSMNLPSVSAVTLRRKSHGDWEVGLGGARPVDEEAAALVPPLQSLGAALPEASCFLLALSGSAQGDTGHLTLGCG